MTRRVSLAALTIIAFNPTHGIFSVLAAGSFPRTGPCALSTFLLTLTALAPETHSGPGYSPAFSDVVSLAPSDSSPGT